MRSKFVYAAAVALLASGMAFAQSSGQNTDTQSGNSPIALPQSGGQNDAQSDMPAMKEGEIQSEKAPAANQEQGMPGAMSAPAVPTEVASPMSEEGAGVAPPTSVPENSDTTEMHGDEKPDSNSTSDKSGDSGMDTP
jgi:hypothetical protein